MRRFPAQMAVLTVMCPTLFTAESRSRRRGTLHRRTKRALIPIENKRHVLEVSPDVLEHVDTVFYGDLRPAVFKELG